MKSITRKNKRKTAHKRKMAHKRKTAHKKNLRIFHRDKRLKYLKGGTYTDTEVPPEVLPEEEVLKQALNILEEKIPPEAEAAAEALNTLQKAPADTHTAAEAEAAAKILIKDEKIEKIEKIPEEDQELISKTENSDEKIELDQDIIKELNNLLLNIKNCDLSTHETIFYKNTHDRNSSTDLGNNLKKLLRSLVVISFGSNIKTQRNDLIYKILCYIIPAGTIPNNRFYEKTNYSTNFNRNNGRLQLNIFWKYNTIVFIPTPGSELNVIVELPVVFITILAK